MQQVTQLNEFKDRRDGERYRYLCLNPDWKFIERLCLSVAAKSAQEFKRQLDAEIDRHIQEQMQQP